MKLKYEKVVSKFAFKCNLRPFTTGVPTFRLHDAAGALAQSFTTGHPKKLRTSLYLFLS